MSRYFVPKINIVVIIEIANEFLNVACSIFPKCFASCQIINAVIAE
jgi:hypothetical protein